MSARDVAERSAPTDHAPPACEHAADVRAPMRWAAIAWGGSMAIVVAFLDRHLAGSGAK